MSIKKYEILMKTADLGSFTKASEVLGYTQSAISHIITGLEDELGLKLLVRDRFGVRLTAEGEALLPAIRAVCQQNQEVTRQGRPVSRAGGGAGAHRHLSQRIGAHFAGPDPLFFPAAPQHHL